MILRSLDILCIFSCLWRASRIARLHTDILPNLETGEMRFEANRFCNYWMEKKRHLKHTQRYRTSQVPNLYLYIYNSKSSHISDFSLWSPSILPLRLAWLYDSFDHLALSIPSFQGSRVCAFLNCIAGVHCPFSSPDRNQPESPATPRHTSEAKASAVSPCCRLLVLGSPTPVQH